MVYIIFLLTFIIAITRSNGSLLRLVSIENEDEDVYWGHSPSLESAHYEYVGREESSLCSDSDDDEPDVFEVRCIICDISRTPECSSFRPGKTIRVDRGGGCVEKYLMLNSNANIPCNTYFNVFQFAPSKSSY